MDLLRQHWERLRPELKKRKLIFFLDYDGTLTPIVRHPDLAALPSSAKKLLTHLGRRHSAVILSGRSLRDIQRKIGIRRLIYGANHGLEIKGPRLNFIHPQALRTKKLFEEILPQLNAAFKDFTGLWFENKVLTLSVHYRELNSGKIAGARKTLLRILRPYLRGRKILLTEGKKVWEIRPFVKWNKGSAALWLLKQKKRFGTRPFPIYLGDDQTDEDAFAALRNKGLTLKITSRPREPSKAQFYLRSPSDALKFLGSVLER